MNKHLRRFLAMAMGLLLAFSCSNGDGDDANPTTGTTSTSGSSSSGLAAPTNVSVDVGDAQLQLSWGAVEGAARYELRHRVVSAAEDPYVLVTNNANGSEIAATAFVLGGLANGVEHVIHIRAISSSGESGAWSEDVVGTPSALPVPTNLVATAGDHQLVISWEAVPEAVRYSVRHRREGALRYAETTTNSQGTPITSSSLTITRLTNRTRYEVQVRAIASSGERGPWSDPTTETPTAIPVPTGVVASIGNEQVQLSWVAVPSAVKYELRHKTDADPTYTGIMNDANGNEISVTSFVVTNLTNEVRIRLQVRAVNRYGERSAWSDFVVVVPSDLAVPGNVRAVEGDRELAISWDSVASAVKYELQHTKEGSADSVKISSDGNNNITANSFVLSGLTNGTLYTVRVRIVDSQGREGPWSSSVLGRPFFLPEPTNMAVVAGDERLQVSWDSVASASKYELRHRVFSAPEGTYVLVTNDAGGGEITATTFVLEGFENGTQQQIQVRSVNGFAQVSEWSSPAMGTPIDLTAPTNLVASPDNGHLQLTWDLVAPAVRYELRHKAFSAPESTYALVTNNADGSEITTTGFLLTNLANGTQYHIQVRSVNGFAQVSEWSSPVMGALLSIAAPASLSVSEGNQELAISWGPVAEAASYELRHMKQGDVDYTLLPEEGADDITNTEFVITDLTNDLPYVVQVRALDSDDSMGAWSTNVSGTPFLLLPPRVALVADTGDDAEDGLTTNATIHVSSRPGSRVVLAMSVNNLPHSFVANENSFTIDATGSTNLDLARLVPSIVPTGSATSVLSLSAEAILGTQRQSTAEATEFTLVSGPEQADVDAIVFALQSDSGNSDDLVTTNSNVAITGDVPMETTLTFAVATNGGEHSHNINPIGQTRLLAVYNFGLAAPGTGLLVVSVTATFTKHGHSVTRAAFEYNLFTWPNTATITYMDDGDASDDGITTSSELRIASFAGLPAEDIKLTGFVVTNLTSRTTNKTDLSEESQLVLGLDYGVDLRLAKKTLAKDERILSVSLDYVGHALTQALSPTIYYPVFPGAAFDRAFLVADEPFGIAITSNDVLLVTSIGEKKVFFYDTNGTSTNLAIDLTPDDEDPTTTSVSSIGSSGSGNGQFSYPNDIIVGDDGKVYVTDLLDSRVQVFSEELVFSESLGGLGETKFPTGLLLHGGYLHLTFFAKGLRTLAESDLTTEGNNIPLGNFYGAVVDADGVYHIANGRDDRVEAWTGSPTSGFTSRGHHHNLRVGDIDIETASSWASDIVIDPSTGRLYISDDYRHQVVVLKYDGSASGSPYTLVGTLGKATPGESGRGNGEFNEPKRMLIHEGKLYVVDEENNRIQVFDVAE